MEDDTRKRHTSMRIVLGIAAIACLTVYLAYRLVTSKDTEAAVAEKVPVKTVEARMKTLEKTLRLTADVRPVDEVDVFPKVPGRIIERILVDRGDRVDKGDVLAILEHSTVDAQLREARSALQIARANKEVADKDYDRMVNLYEQKAVARQTLDHIQAQKDQAAAQLERAQAVLDQILILKEDHTIRAPISGTVTARYLDPGAQSSPGAPIVRITNDSRLKIMTSVSERDFPLIRAGMGCRISVDALPGQVFEGSVALVNPSVNPQSRSGDIEVHLDNRQGLLKPGMFAHLEITLGSVEGIVVPREAVQKMPGTATPFVFAVEGGRAVMKNVETGIEAGTLVQVISGVKEGDHVVITGQNRLKDGTAVREEGPQAGGGDRT